MAKKPFDPVLNIKNEMANMDRRNFRFYRDLDEERTKRASTGAYPVMRWMSILQKDDPGFSEFYITTVNEIANVGFWNLGKHPELQWLLIACCGIGTPLNHGWISGPKRGLSGKLDNLILKINPSLNNQEVDLVKAKLTKEKLENICKDLGWEDSEIKPYHQELKKYQERNNIEE